MMENVEIIKTTVGNIIENYSEKAKNDLNVTTVYTVSNEFGLLPSIDYWIKKGSKNKKSYKMFSDDTSNYNIVRKNMFAYNPSCLNIGSIDCLLTKEAGLVSPMYKIFKIKENIVLPKYLLHFLKSKAIINKIDSLKETGARNRFDFEKWKKIEISIPPLKKQAEIVEILDKFTELTEELTEELTAREAQYDYYRNMLLSEDYLNKISEKLIKEFCPDGVEWKKLWEVTIWDKKFNGIEKYKQLKVNKYYYYLANDLKKLISEQGEIKILTTNKTNIFANEENVKGNITDGEVVCIPWGGNPIVQYYKGKFITGDNRIATSYDTTKLNNKFLFYYLLNNIGLISNFYRGSGIKHPDMSKVLEMKIPIPPIEIQNKIIDILDNFETLVKDIRQGLPREIELRQKQYEYYREKLLTFEEK